MTSTVIVGMSIADAHRRDELLDAASARDASVAFLQQADPPLTAELTRLADAGATTIRLLGVSTGLLAPGHSWLRRIAAHWWRERAEPRPTVLVATRLADSLDRLDVIGTESTPINGDEPGLTSAGWQDVTRHRHQVLVCRGPRCTAQGSADSLRAIVLALVERGLGDDDVLLVHTGCQLPCNRAPVVSVQPDDVWYGGVDPEAAAAIVAEHLVGGTPVESHRLPRSACR